MTLEDDYGMIDGVINNGRRGEELEKAKEHAERTQPEKSLHPGTAGGGKAGVREAAAQACPGEEAPELGSCEPGREVAAGMGLLPGENGRRQYNRLCKGCIHPCKQSFRAVVLDCPHFQSQRVKKAWIRAGNGQNSPPWRRFQTMPL